MTSIELFTFNNNLLYIVCYWH